MAARLLGTPISLVSIVEDGRVRFPVAHGLKISETAREGWFCAGAIGSDDVTVVEDASRDPRFEHHALVEGVPHLRFYAGAPLIASDGFRLGTLAVLDTAPRDGLSEELRGVLAALARTVMEELERRLSEQPEQLPPCDEVMQRVLDALPVGIWLADSQGRARYGNSIGRKIWGGGDPKPLSEYNDLNGWFAESGARLRGDEWSLARAVAKGETVLEQLVEIEALDGQRRVILDSAAPLRSPSGELLGAVAVSQDVTVQRRAQEALHQLSDELRGVINAAPLAIVSLDLDFVVRSWSPEAERLFGWKAEEVVGRPYAVVPPGYEDQYRRHQESIKRGESLRDVETCRRRKDGRLIDVRISSAPLHNPTGAIAGAVVILSDITEKKKAERALEESEVRYRSLVERSPFGIAIECDGTIVYVNPAVLQMWGAASADQLLGRDPSGFVEPEQRAAYRALIEHVLATGQPAPTGEFAGRRMDGAPIYTEVSVLPFSYQGRPAVQVVIRDVTLRKQAEEKLRRQQRESAIVADSLPGAVIVKDRNSVYVTANRRYCEIVHIRPENIPGKTDFDFVSPERALQIRANDERVMSTGKPEYIEELVSVSGKAVEVGIILTPLTDEDGTVTGVAVICIELAEKRALEAALRQSEERFRRAVLEAPIPILIHAEDGRILQLNRAWLEQSGYAAGDLRTVEDCIAPVLGDDARAVREDLQALFRMESGSLQREASFRTPAGKPRTWSISSAPLGRLPDGARVAISMAMDVTERRSLEQQLAQSQKMEAIGQLAGGVAHDFNNLLTVISGYSHLLLQTLAGDPAGAQVQEIEQAAERAAGLTHQLLAFSRKQILRPANVDLNRVLRDSERMLRRLIGEDIEIRLALAPVELRVLVDTGQLTQVIMNLAVNARDAMPKGGVLTVETSEAEFTAGSAESHPGVSAGPYVRVDVSDTGVGMDAATRERIFEPFFTTKGPGSGTGLGLSTVYGIVRQSNGYISVYSEPGLGTSFHIYLPRIFEQPAPAAVRSSGLAAGGGETILLVEDEPALRKLAGEILSRAGYRVIETANGAEAVRACEQAGDSIALLITDLVMPGLSGRELAAQLQRQHPGLRALFMSGYSTHPAMAAGILDGDVPFLQKPFTAGDLADKVRELLRGE